jgi:hypothetical protein
MMRIVLVSLVVAAAAAAQQDPLFRPKGSESQPTTKSVERVSEWPKVEGDALKSVNLDIERLRKCNTPEMGEQAAAGLVTAGPGVVPALVPVLSKERDAEARKRIENVLDKVAGPEHTRLLAPYFTDKSRDVRTWALRRCGLFPDAEIKASAEAAWTAVQAAKQKDPKAEGIDNEYYGAALCATSTGSPAALDTIAKYALDQWGKRGAELRAALEGCRGEEASAFASKWAGDADRAKKVAGLNMLAGCGTKSAIGVVRPLLDSTDGSIRIGAINAMRGIVDGDKPIDKLPVFEAIELAKKWKERAR